MEPYFYLAVRLAVAAYILCKVWNLLFRDRMFGLWDKLLTPAAAKKPRLAERKATGTVLGPTNRVLLDDPRKTEPEPVATTDLELTGFIGQEEPVTADDVEGPEQPYIPSEDELDMPPPDDNEMTSSGVSFEDLDDAARVLKHGSTDEKLCLNVASTLYDIRNTEVMELFVREVCPAEVIENHIKGWVDADGFPHKKRNPVAGFDIGKYV